MGRLRDAMADDGDESAIDISPLIDCVFILLIFFIVTTTFVEETGVEVDKPQAASAARLEKTSILLAVTADGGVVYGGRDIGVAGVQPARAQYPSPMPASNQVGAPPPTASPRCASSLAKCSMNGASMP